MGITSVMFVCFIALALGVYSVMPSRFRWCVLLAASIIFYVSFSPVGIWVLCGTSLFAWAMGLLIQRNKDALACWMESNRELVDKDTRKKYKQKALRIQKLYLVGAVAVIVFLLLLFRYYGHFAFELNQLLHIQLWTAEHILIPLGVSYYSLQLIGYVVDVQRDIVTAEKNPLKVLLYGGFFLSIMQGPFNRYDKLMPQLVEAKAKKSSAEWKKAVYRILLGYVKKLCIADQVAVVVQLSFSHYNELSGLGILLGIVCFAIQLYADFSGYMDIVIGIGMLFGIHLPENFEQPFFACSITEFWQKWHISLGAWLKDYVFYPILKSGLFKRIGKRVSGWFGKEAGRRIPTYIGLLVLWTLIGLWHGAGFTFVFSVGLLQFIYVFCAEIAEPLIERIKKRVRYDRNKAGWHVLSSVKVTFLMIFAWIFFNSKTMADAFSMIKRLFLGMPRMNQIVDLFMFDSPIADASKKIFLLYITACVIFLFVLDYLHAKKVSVCERVIAKGYVAQILLLLVLVLAIIVFGAYGSQYSANNFMYFEL